MNGQSQRRSLIITRWRIYVWFFYGHGRTRSKTIIPCLCPYNLFIVCKVSHLLLLPDIWFDDFKSNDYLDIRTLAIFRFHFSFKEIPRWLFQIFCLQTITLTFRLRDNRRALVNESTSPITKAQDVVFLLYFPVRRRWSLLPNPSMIIVPEKHLWSLGLEHRNTLYLLRDPTMYQVSGGVYSPEHPEEYTPL